jgi:hypothetical protein
MTSTRSRPTIDHAATAVDHAATTGEAVRALIHLTLGQHALSEPAELDRLVAELAIMAGRLPQLLRQLGRWLDAEQCAGRLRSNNTTDPTQIVDRAAAELAKADPAAHDLGRALDDAHQLLAHLAANEPRDARAETGATSRHIHGHQRAAFMAASGQHQMSLDISHIPASSRPGTSSRAEPILKS